LRLGFDFSAAARMAFLTEQSSRFPQPCESRVALFLLFLLGMNYLSVPQIVNAHGFHCDPLRKFADLPPQLCVRSPQLCGLFAYPMGSPGALPAGVFSPSRSGRLRRRAPLRSR
jgi:hypothetical protein